VPGFVNLSRTRRCSWCGSTDVRPSRFRFYDVPFNLLLFRAHRCWNCYGRHFSFVWARYSASLPIPTPSQTDRSKSA